MSELRIGCHLSNAKGYLAMARTARSIGANTFQFFTRNPRGAKAKALDMTDIGAFRAFCVEHDIDRFLAHAPYTLNPCSARPEVREFAMSTFADDMKRMEATPGQSYNFHPGSHVGQGVEVGIDLIVGMLDEVMTPGQSTIVLLETMSGKGSEVGGRFEELAAILARARESSHLGVCLDTCHVWDAGYDIVDHLDEVIDEFDTVIGLERLKAIHLNDSLNPLDSHKDRHARIGEGCIGEEALSRVVRHPLLRDLPFFLETPNELDGYASEIARMRAAHAL